VESSEVGYTQNASINATRFEGKTVAGALDSINNILSQPSHLPIPKIVVRYTIYDKDKNKLKQDTVQIDLDDTLSKTVYVDNGNTIVCEASYSWDKMEGRIDPTTIYGGSWNVLTAPSVSSDIINTELHKSHKFWIEYGVERAGLSVIDGMIKPSVVKDTKEAEINIVFRDKIYYGVCETKPETLDGLECEDIVCGESIDKLINITIENNEIFAFIFPTSWIIEDIIDPYESQINFWFKKSLIVENVEYNMYNCSYGAYTDKNITFKLKPIK
jgi:hypothetical protein